MHTESTWLRDRIQRYHRKETFTGKRPPLELRFGTPNFTVLLNPQKANVTLNNV